MKSRKLVVFGVALTTSLFLSGCGTNSPEDVAKTFANALSKADMDGVKKVTSDNTQKTIDKLIAICNESYYIELTNEVAKVYNIMNQKAEGKLNIRKKMNDPSIKKEIKERMEALTKQYGDVKKLPREKQKKLQLEMMEQFTDKYIKPMIIEQLDTLKIELKHPTEVKDILTRFIITESMGRRARFMSKRDVIQKIVKDGSFQRNENVTPECVAQYTQYDFIDSINAIETKNVSPDQVDVRLELIDQNDKSTKVIIDIEKIKDEWKVSSLPLDIW